MTEEKIKREFETRNLKYQNKQLLNTNTILKKQLTNLNEHFEKRVNEEVDKKLGIAKQNKVIKIKTKSDTRGIWLVIMKTYCIKIMKNCKINILKNLKH